MHEERQHRRRLQLQLRWHPKGMYLNPLDEWQAISNFVANRSPTLPMPFPCHVIVLYPKRLFESQTMGRVSLP